MSLLISRPLSADIPLFPGTPPVKLEAFQTTQRDGSASTTVVLNTHHGTHIDLPKHFSEQGATVSDLIPPLRTFEPAYCIDIRVDDDEGITWEHLAPQAGTMADARALLLRTGWHRHRDDEERYISAHPWLDPSLADALMEHLPHLEILGIDVLSAASPSRPEEGGEVHKKMLLGSRVVLLMEDCDLSAENLPDRVWQLSVAPMIRERLDATPVVAWVDPL
ncbi:cyclase family protein [Methanomassiliicoccus luminyensis]|uniref:cyclase family protein n=1 Tax=Methanomassiliicoccus luminyensis TaxID=1080712 RepID=UPI00035C0CAB|nr:cyclase family protein [Methanomassiliicoccus luminyensis]